MNWKHATTVLIVVTVASYVVYDFIVYYLAGAEATESNTFGGWLKHSLWVVLFTGLLIGHLMGSNPENSTTWRHVGALVVGLLLGYFCTVSP